MLYRDLVPTNWQLITPQVEINHCHSKWFKPYYILKSQLQMGKSKVAYGKGMISWNINMICSSGIYLSWWHHFVITWHFFLDRFWNLQLISIFSNCNKCNLEINRYKMAWKAVVQDGQDEHDHQNKANDWTVTKETPRNRKYTCKNGKVESL